MTENVSQDEKRKHVRFVVRLAIYRGPDQKKLLTNYSVNMSTGGLYIETTEILPVDTLLDVAFMPPGKDKPISCSAKVAWINESDSLKKASLPAGMSIQFLTLSYEDMHTVRDFLTHYELVPTW